MWDPGLVTPYQVLEHTADVGLLATAASLEEAFRDASVGMLEIAGSWHPGEGKTVPISVAAPDTAGVLVDWLSEVLYVQDSGGVSVGGVTVEDVSKGEAHGNVVVRPFAGGSSEGVQIKAVTYHQLKVEPSSDGWIAQVFFDV